MEDLSKDSWKKFLPPPWITAILGAFFLAWLAYSLREIVFLLVIGYSLAYVIDPILTWLEKHDIRRPVGVWVVGAIALLTSLLLFFTIVPRLFVEAGSLVENFPLYLQTAKKGAVEFAKTIDSYLPTKMIQAGGTAQLLNSIKLEDLVNAKLLAGFLSGLLQALLKGYSITLTLLNLVLLPFIVYYIAVDIRRFHYTVLLCFPKKRRLVARRIFQEINSNVSAFVRGQMVVATILSLMYGLGLAIVGVDLWFAIALLSGLGSMVPYVGGLIGVSLATLMGMVTFGTLYHLVLIWGVFGIVQLIEGTLITPTIVGGKVGLSPLTVILALFAGASLFGILGVFFAIPIAATLRVLSTHAARTIFRAPGGGLHLPASQ